MIDKKEFAYLIALALCALLMLVLIKDNQKVKARTANQYLEYMKDNCQCKVFAKPTDYKINNSLMEMIENASQNNSQDTQRTSNSN
jgi:hypothetical protein